MEQRGGLGQGAGGNSDAALVQEGLPLATLGAVGARAQQIGIARRAVGLVVP